MTRKSMPPSLNAAIYDFQQYVCAAYYDGHPKWSPARTLIQRIADLFADFYRGDALRVALRPITDDLGIRVRFVKRKSTGVCGLLTPRTAGFDATVAVANPGTVAARERFTIAHECGHTLFYSRTGASSQPTRIIPRSVTGGARASQREEGLCDQFARALLVRRDVAEQLAGNVVSANVLCRVARELDVSPEVIVSRLLYDLTAWQQFAFYRISFGSGVKVRVLRGTAAHKVTNLPTGPKIEQMLGGETIENCSSSISTLLPNASFARHSRTVAWVCASC